MKRYAATIVTITAIVFSLSSAGCIGRFAAFNRLLDWNRKLDQDPMVNEGIFLVLTIVPVYETLFLADLVVFNSIEFWSGQNPMVSEADYRKTVRSGNAEIVQSFRRKGNLKTMTVDYYRDGKLSRTLVVSKRAGDPEFDGVVAESDGLVKAFRIRTTPEGLTLSRFDSTGSPAMTVFEGRKLQALSQRVAEIVDSRTPQLASAN